MTTPARRAEKRVIVSTLDQLRGARSVAAVAPSGNTYEVRPLNMERYALAGALPASLRELALKGAEGLTEVLGGSQDMIESRGGEVVDYLDGLVRQVVVAPDLTGFDLDELPPMDYRWLVAVAMGETVHDGEGRRLWGKEPLSAYSTFRDFHECPPDCARCLRMVASVARTPLGPSDGLADQGSDHGSVRAAAR